MDHGDFIIRRDGDSYHIERWWGEPEILRPGSSSTPVIERIGRRIRPDGDEGDARIWDAAGLVFDWACSYAMSKISASGDPHPISEPAARPYLADGTSVTVKRYPDSYDGQDRAVIQVRLRVFVDGVQRSVNCEVEPRFDLGDRQPDSQMRDAIVLLADWMVEETARQTKGFSGRLGAI